MARKRVAVTEEEIAKEVLAAWRRAEPASWQPAKLGEFEFTPKMYVDFLVQEGRRRVGIERAADILKDGWLQGRYDRRRAQLRRGPGTYVYRPKGTPAGE